MPDYVDPFLHPPIQQQPLVTMHYIPDNAVEDEDSSVPFEIALQRLYATLDEAISFFSQLDRSFDQETKPISVYAQPPVLDKIWRSKVAAANGRLNHEQQQQQQQSSSWFGKHKARLSSFFAKHRGGPNISPQANTMQVQTGFHDYVKRVEKDLVEAICARWPPGIKQGFDPEMMFDMPLISLGFLYDRMTGMADRLQTIGPEIQRKHSKFRGFVLDSESLQISMEQNGEFWQ